VDASFVFHDAGCSRQHHIRRGGYSSDYKVVSIKQEVDQHRKLLERGGTSALSPLRPYKLKIGKA
jgi:hypothetical protein